MRSLLVFKKNVWKSSLWSDMIHLVPWPKLQNFAFSESSVIWKKKMWHDWLSKWKGCLMSISREMVLQSFDLNSPCPSQVPKNHPKYFFLQHLDFISFDRARYYKVNLPILTPSTALIWEFSSFQNFSSYFLGSCPHLNFGKILHLKNLRWFERNQDIYIDGQTFRSIQLLVSKILDFPKSSLPFLFREEKILQKSGKENFITCSKIPKFFFPPISEDGCWIWTSAKNLGLPSERIYQNLTLKKNLGFFWKKSCPRNFLRLRKKIDRFHHIRKT